MAASSGAPALAPAASEDSVSASSSVVGGVSPVQAAPRARHADYGQHWGEGAARCFSIEGDFLDEDQGVRLMPVPESFICPISLTIMVDPVAAVDGCIYDRDYIERWFRQRRQERKPLTSPVTGLQLTSTTLMPLAALQRAIESYLTHRPELRQAPTVGRSFEEAAQVLQKELLEKQTMQESAQDELKRLREENEILQRALQETEAANAGLVNELQVTRERYRHAKARIKELEQEQAAAWSRESANASASGSAAPAESARHTASDGTSKSAQEGRGAKDDVQEKKRRKDGGSAASGEFTRRGSRRADNAKSEAASESAAGDVVNMSRLGSSRSPCAKRVMSVFPREFAPFVLSLLLVALLLVVLAAAFFGWTIPASAVVTADISESSASIETQVASAKDSAEPTVALQGEPVHTLTSNTISSLSSPLSASKMTEPLSSVGPMSPAASVSEPSSISITDSIASDILPPPPAAEVSRDALAKKRDKKASKSERSVASGDPISDDSLKQQVELIRSGSPEEKRHAAFTLWNLAIADSNVQVGLARAGAIKPLVKLLRDLREEEADVQEAVAAVLGSLANNAKYRIAIVKAGAIKPLIEILKNDKAGARVVAARTLWGLASQNVENQAAIVKAGAIPLLVRLLDDGVARVRVAAAAALCGLAIDHVENQVAIAKAGAIAPLVRLLREDEAGARVAAAAALRNLAISNVDNQMAVVNAGVIKPLVELLRDDKAGAQEDAAFMLANLAANNANHQNWIAKAGAIAPLVELLGSAVAEVPEAAALVLRNLAGDNKRNAAEIARAGAVPALSHLLFYGGPGSRKQAAWALWNLATADSDNLELMARAGAVAPLIEILGADSPEAKEGIATTLLKLAQRHDQEAGS